MTAGEAERGKQALRAFKFAYGWYICLGIAVALLSPTDVLSSFPMLSDLIHMMSVVIPAISKVAAYSTIPDVCSLFVAVMWVAQPIATGLILLNAPLRPIKLNSIRQWILGVFVGIPLGIFLLIYIPFVFVEPDVLELGYDQTRGGVAFTLMMQTRIGLAVIGTSWMFVSSIFQMYLVALLLSWLGILKNM